MEEEQEKTSEFGKGFIYPLFLWAKHCERIRSDLVIYKSIGSDSAYSMWFYSAGDHLYEIDIPKAFAETKVGRLIKEFLDFVRPLRLPIGIERQGTEEDYKKAFEMLEEIFIELDEYLGVEPIKATWN